MEIVKISIKDIEADKFQPRKLFEDVDKLAMSIIKEGLLEPLKVRRERERYLLLDGERRLKALGILASKDDRFLMADCIILSPKDAFIMQLSTDLHKRRLNPFEEAEAFKKLLDEGWEVKDLKARLGVSGAVITRRIKLLGLSNKTKELIKNGTIPQSVVTEIDFFKFRRNEARILERLGSEIGFHNLNRKRTEIRRIIEEETEKESAVLEHLRIDVDNFRRVISSYNFKLNPDDFKVDIDELIGENIRDSHKVIKEVLIKTELIMGIRERLLGLKQDLEQFRIKYGGGCELTEEMAQVEAIAKELDGN